jgi:hypothetical protein
LKETELETKHAYTECLHNLTVCLNQTSTCDRQEHAEPSRDESKARNESEEHRRTSTTDAPSAWQQVWEACVVVGFALAASFWCCCAGPKKKSANPPVKRVQPPSSQQAQVQQAQHVQAPPAQVQQVANVAPASVSPPAAGLSPGSLPAHQLSDLLKPFVGNQDVSTRLTTANNVGYNKEVWDAYMNSSAWTKYVENNRSSPELQPILQLKVATQSGVRPAFVALLTSSSAQLKRLLAADQVNLPATTSQPRTREAARDHFLAGY